jgi:hypothetical protein
MYAAARMQLGDLQSYRIGLETYDPDKLGLGPLMRQNTGASAEDKWAGPLPLAVARPMEQSTSIPCAYPWVMQWSDSLTSRLDWMFLADNASAAATRRVVAYQFDRLTGVVTWKGFITVTFPTATNHTIRALRMTYDTHSAGTVAVSGTAVTGTGTAWQSNRACVGNRIGFGSTDPTQIATWYEISAIGSDTGITLSTNAGTISAGTPYVIEDLRAVIVTTNATTTNGGLYVVKGLSIDIFSPLGTTIPAATTVDNIRACYWLKSAATITEITANGIGVQAKTSFQSQMAWLGSGTTTNQLFKFDIRAALTLTSGAATNAFQYSTAVSATLTGTASQLNNGRVAAPNHGPGQGVDCYYFTTTTRVYRTKALSTITTGDTTWLTAGDVMQEVPPGTTATNAATAAMNSIEYVASIDKFVIATNGGSYRTYVTQYRTDAGQIDRVFGANLFQYMQTLADQSAPLAATTINTIATVWAEGGLLYYLLASTTLANNTMVITPLAADWEYAAASGNRIILPRMAVEAASRFVQAFAQELPIMGGTSGYNLGHPTEPLRLYYRTAGIADNSGAWTLLPFSGDMSGITGASIIQLMAEFRTVGVLSIPARLYNVGVMYDSDDSLPAELRWNLGDSDNSNGTVGFTQTVVFGSLSSLTITYYRADNDAVVLVQGSGSTTNGTFEYWTGSAWSAGLGSNAAGTRRRFVPTAGLPTGVDVYAKVVAA